MMDEERKQLVVTLGMLGFVSNENTYVLMKGSIYITVILLPKIEIYVGGKTNLVKCREVTILPHIAKKTITRLLTLHAQCETDEEFFERIKERPKNPVPFKLD